MMNHFVLWILGLFSGLVIAGGSFGCTKQQGIDLTKVLVNIAVDVCQIAPQVIPAGNPAGTVVGLLCPLINDPNTLVPVIVSAAGWNSMKAEYAAKHPGAAK